jgi:hypothetical protein
MDRQVLLGKIFWQLHRPWHFRHQPGATALSLQETVKGLQTLLVTDSAALLVRTLTAASQRAVCLDDLARLDIVLFQEGVDQRVWRASATLQDSTSVLFGIIVARAPGPSSAITQRDYAHLAQLQRLQPEYCVAPYVFGTLPQGVAAFTVEWLDLHKELVFDITVDGGVFFVNAPRAHRHFPPTLSRRIWRRLMTVLCCYPVLRGVNIQAGDFVGCVSEDGTDVALKLTTAREFHPDVGPAEQIHAMLATAITASGYLSDGTQSFDRRMTEEVFVHRMTAVLRRRFGEKAQSLAQRQWVMFQDGAFARQEDWLKEDSILAMYDCLCATEPATAWRETVRRWTDYVAAVEAGTVPSSWWFPALEVPTLLERLAEQYLLQE